MSQADTDLLFKTTGRPITIKQITTGLARGGTYPSTYDDVPEPYRKSLEEGNIRPEWASLDYANRYSYPSGFQIRAEAQAERLTEPETEQILLEIGWSPKWAKHFATAWTTTSTSTASSWTAKADTQLWTTTHRSYVAGESDDAIARANLAVVGVPDAEVDGILARWAREAATVRKQLTPAQIKKAYVKAAKNDATGQPWTRDEAIEALVDRGYSVTDANSYLDIP